MSGKEVHEITSRYPDDHPLAGHVQRVGQRLPEATSLNILMMDGRHITITLHKDHVDELNLNELWHLLCDAQTHETEHRKHLPNYIGDKVIESHQNQMTLLCPPLGVLHG